MTRGKKLLTALGLVVIVLGGLAWWVTRGTPAEHTLDQLSGTDPVLVEAKSEFVPSVAIAKPVGWAAGEAPVAAKGLTVSRFAEGLTHPRTMLLLPNGDVIVALTEAQPESGGGLFGMIARYLMGRAGSGGASPDTLVLLRDANGDGAAEQRFVLRKDEGLESPSGLAWNADKLYVANHNAVLAFDYKLGETALAGKPEKLMDLPGGGHWMRNLLLSGDGKTLYIAVGSLTNIADAGMEAETGRAAIWEYDLAGRHGRPFASGLRNPNGMDWNPSTGELWTVVNERDMLGPDLVPDYLTNVPIGAHYGWPWIYWKKFTDRRVAPPPPIYIDDYVRKPEYALGAHVAPLGLAFAKGGGRLGERFANGAFIARHGSWNRKPLSGYDVVFVRFDANGNPLGLPQPVLTGFLTGKDTTRGRPTWVVQAGDGALLVTDDTAGIIWRVIAPGAAPAAAPKALAAVKIEPQKVTAPDPYAGTAASFRKEDDEAGQ